MLDVMPMQSCPVHREVLLLFRETGWHRGWWQPGMYPLGAEPAGWAEPVPAFLNGPDLPFFDTMKS